MVGYEYIIGVAVIIGIACLPVYISYSNYRIQRDKPMQELKEAVVILTTKFESFISILERYDDELEKHGAKLENHSGTLAQFAVRIEQLENKDKE